MIVVTGAGGSLADCKVYRRIIEAQRRAVEGFGYDHAIYDLGGLGIGDTHLVASSEFAPQVNGDSLPAATFKATLVIQWLDGEADDNELVCWMDADCLPLRDFNPPADLGGFDAAVTLRPANEIGLSHNPALDYLNSGVVFIRNTPGGIRFCQDWARLSKELNSDQWALNRCLCGSDDPAWWATVVRSMEPGPGTAIMPASGVVLVLPCEEWNSWSFPPAPGTRILHFKRGIRHAAKDYINR